MEGRQGNPRQTIFSIFLVKKFISFSGGVESSTMCVLFGKQADAIFADTGFEHKEIYDRIDLVESWVREFHQNDFTIHRIKGKATANGIVCDTLPDYILASKFYPNFKARYCTGDFKIVPIDNFLKQYKDDGVELMIGLNADEIDMRTGNHGNQKFIDYSYPLADAGLSRKACTTILKKADLHPEFPPYMKRGGCIGCYYKSRKEYEAMALLNPGEFKIVEDIEEAIQDKRGKHFSILQGAKMSDIRKSTENMLFRPDEIYPVINDATKCGVFCNR